MRLAKCVSYETSPREAKQVRRMRERENEVIELISRREVASWTANLRRLGQTRQRQDGTLCQAERQRRRTASRCYSWLGGGPAYGRASGSGELAAVYESG